MQQVARCRKIVAVHCDRDVLGAVGEDAWGRLAPREAGAFESLAVLRNLAYGSIASSVHEYSQLATSYPVAVLRNPAYGSQTNTGRTAGA